nr:uncharacterized protein LOC106691378 isoform X1 [Halyomorpha halys]
MKFLMSFLISFKSFPENDIQVYSESASIKGSEGEQPYVRFRAHPDRKNIFNIMYSIPSPKEIIERKISVACWSPMFKIYSKKEDHHFRTEKNGGKTWAAFSVRHKLEDMKPEQFKTILAKSVEFYFNEDSKYLQRFRSEQWGVYLRSNKPKEIKFTPVCSYRDRPIKEAGKLASLRSLASDKKKGNVNLNKNKIEAFKNKLEPEICSNVARAHLHKMKKAIDKVSKESDSDKTSKASANCTMFLPVANLFYDKSVWVLKNERPISRNIQDIFVFVTVYSFLDEEAREIINPFCINLHSLQYLPVKGLEAEGISRIFVEYELEPIIPLTRTKVQILDDGFESINQFKDIKVFLTDKFSPLTIISSLQSKKLLVRVIGIKGILPEIKYTKDIVLYGSDMNDDRFSNCIKLPMKNEFYEFPRAKPTTPVKHKSLKQQRSSKVSAGKSGRGKSKKRDEMQLLYRNKEFHVLIGIARIDLSPLIFGNSSITAYEQLSSLPVKIGGHLTPDIEHLTITVVHRDFCRYEKPEVRNSLLYENNAMVKLTAKCGFLLKPQAANMDPSIMKGFSRVIVILMDKDFAINILQKILTQNRESLDMKDYDLPLVPFRKMYKTEQAEPSKSLLLFPKESIYWTKDVVSENPTKMISSEMYFTGFCIDCLNTILMYIEGPTVTTFPTLLTELNKFNVNQGRIFYSSDLIYETRIYGAFKHFGGIYCITMASTVEDFIRKGCSLCYGVSVPSPAWKALKMISKLLEGITVLKAVQDNYLPHPEQLISFDIEFGLPHCIIK